MWTLVEAARNPNNNFRGGTSGALLRGSAPWCEVAFEGTSSIRAGGSADDAASQCWKRRHVFLCQDVLKPLLALFPSGSAAASQQGALWPEIWATKALLTGRSRSNFRSFHELCATYQAYPAASGHQLFDSSRREEHAGLANGSCHHSSFACVQGGEFSPSLAPEPSLQRGQSPRHAGFSRVLWGLEGAELSRCMFSQGHA